MATIKHIAKLAGVSRGTVDRVLNNRGSVNPETRAKVLEVVQRINYQTNASGRALSVQNREFKVVYLYASEAENPFFEDVIAGMRQRAQLYAGYNIALTPHQVFEFTPDAFGRALDAVLAAGDVSGFIMSPFLAEECGQTIDRVADLGIPVITCNTDIASSRRLAYVGSDYYHCGAIAAGCLAQITGGQANAAVLYGCDFPSSASLKTNVPANRVIAFLDTIQQHYPGIRIVDHVNSQDDNYECYHVTKKLFAEHPEVDAVFLSSIAAKGFIRALRDLGRKVKVVTVDDFPDVREGVIEGILDVTVCQNPRWQGAKAMALLLDCLIHKRYPENEFYHCQMEIKIRESFCERRQPPASGESFSN